MGLGWLFGKKKVVPRVPFPESKPFDEKTFKFSKKFTGETIIEPEHLQAAAGIEQTFNPTEEKAPSSLSTLPAPPFPFTSPIMAPLSTSKSSSESFAEPVYVKVEVYQRILGELDKLKSNLNKLQETNRHLESSEYNEENNFEKLKRAMKITHDRLLQADKILFKSQGE